MHSLWVPGNRDLIDARPVDLVALFWTDEFRELLTSETNRYAKKFLENTQLKEKTGFHSCFDVTVQKMKAFLSLHLSMRQVEKSKIEDYWAEFWISTTPGFGKVMVGIDLK